MAATPGRQFFDGHLARISAGKIDEMVDNDYTENAVLITFFDGLDTPPPITVRGRAAIKDFFHRYMEVVGNIDVKSLDFAEDYDGKQGGICFQAAFDSRLGRLTAADAWFMKDGKIDFHQGFFFKNA
jgi:hypothetical protein